MPREIFGPVLHIATFRAAEIDAVIDAVNATGYGLTFGLHTRIDDRVQRIVERLRVGNTYVNRNQIGAVVGSQPFGGEGLSGTGPKAGGPHYLPRFAAKPAPVAAADSHVTTLDEVRAALKAATATAGTGRGADPARSDGRIEPPDIGAARAPSLPWPGTPLRRWNRPGACVNWGVKRWKRRGCRPMCWQRSQDFPAFCTGAQPSSVAPYAQALAGRAGPILPLIAQPDVAHVRLERHVCIDTTASGGNAQLLAEVGTA